MKRLSNGNRVWQPNPDSRICSKHFPDQQPTSLNPDPILKMGYEKSVLKPRRSPKKRIALAKKIISVDEAAKENCPPEDQPQDTSNQAVCPNDIKEETLQAAVSTPVSDCSDCQTKDKTIKNLETRCSQMLKQLTAFQWFSNFNLTDDDHARFYTGLPSKSAWQALLNVLTTKCNDIQYWAGPSRWLAKETASIVQLGRDDAKRSLSFEDEILMTFMRIKLGLLEQDLAQRFGISASTVSRITITLIKFLCYHLSSLIYNPSLRGNVAPRPLSFLIPPYSKVRYIIDATELFIGTPKNLLLQSACWSDYKHHCTIKYLLSICPNGHFNYVSKGWGGRVTDKYLTLNCGFMDIVQRGEAILADRGFPIREEALLRGVDVIIPPGKRGQDQMPMDDVQKTKDIANRRIYIENAIGRLKQFRLLKQELPISLLHCADDIVTICAAVCNILPPLVKELQ